MRLTRTHRATLVLLVVAVLGSFGSVGATPGRSVPPPPPPEMEAFLDAGLQIYRLDAIGGLPGSAGAFNLLVVNGPMQGIFALPFTFDNNGQASVAIPFSALRTGYDLVVAIQLIALGADGAPYASPLWALTSRNYQVLNPATPPCSNCPTVPGGWVEYVPWPGTGPTAPLYPHTLVAMLGGEDRLPGQPMLALESGPAGSFPIN